MQQMDESSLVPNNGNDAQTPLEAKNSVESMDGITTDDDSVARNLIDGAITDPPGSAADDAACLDEVDEDNNVVGGGDSISDDEFEFGGWNSSVDDLETLSADELFADGRIRPLFEVFRDLPENNQQKLLFLAPTSPRRTVKLKSIFLEDGEQQETESDDLERIPAGTYCVWSPKLRTEGPDRCRKSKSTGTSSRRWRLRDLLNRSNSDGKNVFVFMAPPEREKEKEGRKKLPGNKTPAEGKRRSTGGLPEYLLSGKEREGERRRSSYLPYKRSIVGLFGNLHIHN